MVLTAEENNQAISARNEKKLQLMNDNGIIAPYLATSLNILFELENKSQYNFKKTLRQLG